MEFGSRQVAGEGMRYRFEAATQPRLPSLLLLHGTGGDEHDLIDLGLHLLPGAALVSPRGPVLEEGQARFFRRSAPGIFDLQDLARRTAELRQFWLRVRAARGLGPELIAVGLSNGANIAASLLFSPPNVLAGAVLLRATVPFEPESLPDLAGTPVFIAAARRDALVAPEQTELLATLLTSAGARVEVNWTEGGHQLSAADVAAARSWLQSTDLAHPAEDV